MSVLAMTWGEFFTELWNTEMWSWDSFYGGAIILVVGFLVFPR